MTINKKLHLGFGVILGVLTLLVMFTIGALIKQHGTKDAMKHALDSAQATETIRFQIMQDRVFLTNYLLSGDNRELDKLNMGMAAIAKQTHDAAATSESQQVKDVFSRADDGEREWFKNFAGPLVEKRKQVDAGNATVAELQIFYLQQDPASWIAKANENLDQAKQLSKTDLDEKVQSDDSIASLTRGFLIVVALIAIGAGIFIARFTAKSITEPLFKLMIVSKDISESGDLDQKIEIDREDEIGKLSNDFDNMIVYLKEMAAVSEAIAGGDLTVAIEPRSKRDTLMQAFGRMTEGLRTM